MSHIADQFSGGIWPLQDFSPRSAQVMDTRCVRYAARIKDVDRYGRPVIERASAGDVVANLHWDPSTREIGGWAAAWPVVGGSVVQSSNYSATGAAQQEAKAASGAANDGRGGGAGGGVGANGKDPASKYRPLTAAEVAAGWTRRWDGAMVREVTAAPGPFTLNAPGGGAYISGPGYSRPATQGYYTWRKNRYVPLNEGGAVLAPGGSLGPAGALGLLGSLGASSRGTALTYSDETEVVYSRPVRTSGFGADGSFAWKSAPMPQGGPSAPPGTVGIMAAGTMHTSEQPVYMHTDPRMVAVNNGPDPRASSVVMDTDGNGGYDLTRRGQLHSAWRVMPQLTGDFPTGKGATLAWQMSGAERDGVPGFGAVAGLSSGVKTTLASQPTLTPSSSGIAGTPSRGPTSLASIAGSASGDRQLFAALTLAMYQSPPPYLSGMTQQGGKALPAVQGSPGIDPVSRAADSANLPQIAVALTSARTGGPIEIGHPTKDRHRIGSSGEHAVNQGHLAPYAPWYADPARDGPMRFEAMGRPDAASYPNWSHVHLVWDPVSRWDSRLPVGSNLPTITQPGQWRWYAEVPTLDEGGPPKRPGEITPPDDKTPPPVKRPTPHTPSEPNMPPTPPPVTTPTSRRSPLTPRPGARAFGMDGAALETERHLATAVAAGRGLGAPMAIADRNLPDTRLRGEAKWYPPQPVTAFDPAQHRVRPVLQRVSPTGITDGVTGFTTAVATTVLLGRPQSLVVGMPDLRVSQGASPDTIAAQVGDRPMVGRIEAWGGQTGMVWSRTQRAGASRFEAGTGPGGFLLLPPEWDMADVLAGSSPITASRAYFAAYPGTYWGAGLPDLATGGLKTGYRWGGSAGALTFERLDSAGSATTSFGGDASGYFFLRESGGATLTVGAVTDGQFLKRVGTTLVSAAGTGATTESAVVDVAKTSDYAVTAPDSGTTFTQEGAAGTVIFTLPAGGDGLMVHFVVVASQTLKIDTDTGDAIYVGSSVSSGGSGYIECATPGATVTLVGVAGSWYARSVTGTWTVA